MMISPAAVSLILKFEVSSPAAYSPAPVWPGGASGVTVGVGYDLGYATAAEIARDWAALPRATVMRLQSCAGRTADLAEHLAHAMGNVEIPWPAAQAVYESCTLPHCTALALATFPNVDKLSGDSLGALVSLVMNRGTSMVDPKKYPNSRLEMRQIRDACAAQNFVAVPGLIRAMKRLWLNGLIARREAEAVLFEAGLGAAPHLYEISADDLNAAELSSLQGSLHD